MTKHLADFGPAGALTRSEDERTARPLLIDDGAISGAAMHGPRDIAKRLPEFSLWRASHSAGHDVPLAINGDGQEYVIDCNGGMGGDPSSPDHYAITLRTNFGRVSVISREAVAGCLPFVLSAPPGYRIAEFYGRQHGVLGCVGVTLDRLGDGATQAVLPAITWAGPSGSSGEDAHDFRVSAQRLGNKFRPLPETIEVFSNGVDWPVCGLRLWFRSLTDPANVQSVSAGDTDGLAAHIMSLMPHADDGTHYLARIEGQFANGRITWLKLSQHGAAHTPRIVEAGAWRDDAIDFAYDAPDDFAIAGFFGRCEGEGGLCALGIGLVALDPHQW